MFCDECGKEATGESEFCTFCGAALKAPVAAPPPQPGGVTPPATPVGQQAVPPAHPGTRAGPPKKSPLPWILGGVGVAVGIAVVLVLVFVVFSGGSGASDPEQVVETLWEAFEKQDVDMLMSTMEPSYRSELEDAIGKEYKEFLEEYYVSTLPEDIEFTITKMDTEIDGDKAVVTVVDGTMTYTDAYGEKVTEEASESDVETTELVKVDGEWYISSDLWKEMGLDPEYLKDLADKEEDGETTTEDPDTTSTKEELDVPVYPGAKFDEDASSEIEAENMGMVGTVYFTDDPVDKVIAWYKDELSGEPNYSFDDSMADEETDGGVFSFGSIHMPTSVGVMEEEGRTLIFIGLIAQ